MNGEMTNLYISNDLDANSSGGNVTKQELSALESLGDDVIKIGHDDMNPSKFGLPDTSFLQDYLTLEYLSKIDLSKIHLAHMYSTPYPQTIRYLKAKNIKTTITCAAHDRKESIKEFHNLGLVYPFEHIKNDILWKIFSSDIKEADIVITPSKASAEFLLKEGAKRVEIISHGINIPDEKDIKPFPNEFRVGYIGSWGPDKGVIYLLQSWSSLKYNDSILILAGNQSQYIEQEPFKKYAIEGKYHLTGFIPNIADFYNYIDIYIQPSVVEGFGLETLEAMSYGRPVIVSDGAGSADVVTDGVDGFIVPKSNQEAITKEIQYFKDNPKEIEMMGINARKKSIRYDWKIIKEKYISVWKNLLDK
jgi:glycosyltransferase involved in cell wall biosynthesis